MAFALQSRVSEVFAVDIHPAARIGARFTATAARATHHACNVPFSGSITCTAVIVIVLQDMPVMMLIMATSYCSLHCCLPGLTYRWWN